MLFNKKAPSLIMGALTWHIHVCISSVAGVWQNTKTWTLQHCHCPTCRLRPVPTAAATVNYIPHLAHTHGKIAVLSCGRAGSGGTKVTCVYHMAAMHHMFHDKTVVAAARTYLGRGSAGRRGRCGRSETARLCLHPWMMFNFKQIFIKQERWSCTPASANANLWVQFAVQAGHTSSSGRSLLA